MYIYTLLRDPLVCRFRFANLNLCDLFFVRFNCELSKNSVSAHIKYCGRETALEALPFRLESCLKKNRWTPVE